MTNPIDRALERLEVITEGNFDHIIRPILSDLAAEMFAEGVMAPCKCEAKARLAAVVEFVTAERYPPEREDYICDTILALARGEEKHD